MGVAISACFAKYATIEGRSSRSEFWYFYLFGILIYIGANILSVTENSSYIVGLANLVLFLPTLSVGVRRLHDVDRSGWFLIVPIYNIVLLATAGSPHSNRFGSI